MSETETVSFTTEQVAAQQRVITAAADLCEVYEEDNCVDLDLMSELSKALKLLKEESK